MRHSDRLRKEDAENLAKAVAKELGLQKIVERLSEQSTITPERERELAWSHIKDLIGSRAAPNDIVAAIRKRLHGNYDADEVKQSWIVLTETDPMVFVRVFCLLPYLAGRPDRSARPDHSRILRQPVDP